MGTPGVSSKNARACKKTHYSLNCTPLIHIAGVCRCKQYHHRIADFSERRKGQQGSTANPIAHWAGTGPTHVHQRSCCGEQAPCRSQSLGAVEERTQLLRANTEPCNWERREAWRSCRRSTPRRYIARCPRFLQRPRAADIRHSHRRWQFEWRPQHVFSGSYWTNAARRLLCRGLELEAVHVRRLFKIQVSRKFSFIPANVMNDLYMSSA